MIGRLSGIIIDKKAPFLLIDVMGVGYELEVPLSTFCALPNEGKKVNLLIHTYMREGAIHLFGFIDTVERDFFRLLIKVNGVGTKMALTILSGASVDIFADYVRQEDVSALIRLPGIGKKMAQRLIVEMKDKLHQEKFSGLNHANTDTKSPAIQHDSNQQEALNALIALGYKPSEASKMINPVAKHASTTEDIIRLALKNTLHHE